MQKVIWALFTSVPDRLVVSVGYYDLPAIGL